MADENYSEIFQAFSNIFDNFGDFINDVIYPQSSGIGGTIAIILILITIFAVMILAFKRGIFLFRRKRY